MINRNATKGFWGRVDTFWWGGVVGGLGRVQVNGGRGGILGRNLGDDLAAEEFVHFPVGSLAFAGAIGRGLAFGASFDGDFGLGFLADGAGGHRGSFFFLFLEGAMNSKERK